MASFDIVSKVDPQVMDNAVNVARKEIMNRYDFRDTKGSLEYDKKNSEAVGVCRMHLQTPQEAQFRFMGIHENYQGKGLGKLLIDYLEDKARSIGAEYIVLQAREKAVSFY